jgi:hypothetical protein
MADIGYRHKGDTGPMYNPERDYAYITPTLMRIAIERLEVNETIDSKAWREKEQITNEEVCTAVSAFANAQRDFVNAADPVSSFEQALLRHNFYDCRFVVRQFIFATFGEVFCAAWFVAVREVSLVGEESPAHADMARFCAAVREFVSQNHGATYNANFMAEHLRMYQDVLQARIQKLLGDVKTQQTILIKKDEEIRALKTELAAAKQSFVSRLLSGFRKKKS